LKPGFYGFAEELDDAADGCPAPARLSSYGKLAHPQLEVQVRYGEHLAWRELGPGKRRAREVAELPSTRLTKVALCVGLVRFFAVFSCFGGAAVGAFYAIGLAVLSEYLYDLLVC